jgi:hypothetical protein
MDRSRAVNAGAHTVQVQWAVFDAGNDSTVGFHLDNFSLTVERAV